jgi:hypothetical protein
MRPGAVGVLALALVALRYAAEAASMPLAEADPVLWKWLPHGENMWQPYRRRLTSDSRLGPAEMFTIPSMTTVASKRATDNVVYDAVHRIVLYRDGCCDWEETVLAAVAEPPPRRVRFGQLGAVRTLRGIGLGAAPAAVIHSYGPARMHRSATKPALEVLSYYRDMHTPGSACGRYENFVFTADRLTEIHAGHSC